VDNALNRTLICIAALTAALWLLATPGYAQDLPLPFQAELKHVIDGDSIVVVRTGNDAQGNGAGSVLELRLWGIDAPEFGAPWSKKTKRRLQRVLHGQTLDVLPVTFDRYERLVSEIHVAEINVGLRLVEEGLAWVYRRYNNRQDYIDAQIGAKESLAGFWADPVASAVPPWEWRDQDRIDRRSASACGPSTARIVGNRRSKIFHYRGCPDFARVSCNNRVEFDSATRAQKRGFRAARNCKKDLQ